ncbi:MAG: alpha-amylase [bacterium]|nr:alpha-amylase [bacterium]
MSINGILMQYFEWDLPADGSLWTQVKEKAGALAEAGITALWLPPAYKGYDGTNDSGYAVYDIYDLGEFPQKSQTGEVRTKYGTKEQYIEAIEACHKAGIQVYADVVLNHMTGAEMTETVDTIVWRRNSRSESWYCTNEHETIEAWTKFLFEKRGGKYSSFQWNKDCFDGADTNGMLPADPNKVYLFAGKEWDPDTNFDFLNCSDLDVQNPEVIKELKSWGEWYLNTTNVDGVRLDALKHIGPKFYNEWLDFMGSKKQIFAVGEYYDLDNRELQNYLGHITTDKVTMHLFDFPLHERFYLASDQMNYPLKNLLHDTLVSSCPLNAVTFVDNHDTQNRLVQDPGTQAREVKEWFRPHAYAFILLREAGYPCVFYKDYPDTETKEGSLVAVITALMKIRRTLAYGSQHDYVSDLNEIGWTRESVDGRSGVAVVLSKDGSNPITMYVGGSEHQTAYIDVMHTITDPVIIGEDGRASFPVIQGKLSVWIRQDAYTELFIEQEKCE